MNRMVRFASGIASLCVLASAAAAQTASVEIVAPASYKRPVVERPAQLQRLLAAAVNDTLNSPEAKNFKPEQVAATLIDVRDAGRWQMADVRGDARIYPASVVKLFYLAALERQLNDGKIRSSPELMRGRRDMIVDSSNEATQYILDVLTDTSSGAELPPEQFEAWQYKRNRVNRYFASMGYENINVNQKTFCEDAYGVEQQTRRYKGENRNALTTNATARLMAEIVLGRMAPPAETEQMMTLLRRDPFAPTKDNEDQAHGFTGIMFIDKHLTDAKLWSKAGWTSTARHDVAYIETADGQKFVLVVFTENHATERQVIPAIAGRVLDALRNQKK